MKVLAVIGTRPEAIKMAILIKTLRKNKIKCDICSTGQHKEMLDQVLNLFELTPRYDLKLMNTKGGIIHLISEAVHEISKVLIEYKPDMILVHGDTASTLAGTLAAFYLKIPIAHIEAGLRTGNLSSPWPEEGNRRAVSSLATLHFAPTEESKKNLIKENIRFNNIFITGNTVIDSLKFISEQLDLDKEKTFHLEKKFNFLPNKRMILVTCHRRENIDSGINEIFEAINEVAIKRNDIIIVFPVHLNPQVQSYAKKILDKTPNIFLIPPQEYIDFIYLMKKSYLILSDSGGIQEEAPSLGKPVLLLRETSERPEAVMAGTVKLVGNNKKKILAEIDHLLDNQEAYGIMSNIKNPYGDGLASERIAHEIFNQLIKVN